MAWVRERGSARGYVNTETGERLSRRQYDARQSAAGLRKRLPLPRAVKFRQQQSKYNDLVNTRYKEILNERLSALDTKGLTIVEESQAIDRITKSIKKSEIRNDPEFKAQIKNLKRLGKIPKDERTPAQTEALINTLEYLGKREGIKHEVQPGDSDYFRRGMLVKSPKTKQYIMKKTDRIPRLSRYA